MIIVCEIIFDGFHTRFRHCLTTFLCMTFDYDFQSFFMRAHARTHTLHAYITHKCNNNIRIFALNLINLSSPVSITAANRYLLRSPYCIAALNWNIDGEHERLRHICMRLLLSNLIIVLILHAIEMECTPDTEWKRIREMIFLRTNVAFSCSVNIHEC